LIIDHKSVRSRFFVLKYLGFSCKNYSIFTVFFNVFAIDNSNAKLDIIFSKLFLYRLQIFDIWNPAVIKSSDKFLEEDYIIISNLLLLDMLFIFNFSDNNKIILFDFEII